MRMAAWPPEPREATGSAHPEVVAVGVPVHGHGHAPDELAEMFSRAATSEACIAVGCEAGADSHHGP